MNDWNAQRKARGRIKRAQLRRKRQRVSIASVLILMCLSVLAIGAVDYGKTKSKQIEIADTKHRSFSMPRMSPMLARAAAPQPESDLPELLNINERFPDYREGLGRADQGNSGGDEDVPDEADAGPQKRMVVLDDLRAAPPKSLFIKAVFENSEDNFKRKKRRKWLSHDFTDDKPDLHGEHRKKKRKKKKGGPPIPEPGTGLLLGLGLTGLGGVRRADRKRRRAERFNQNASRNSGDEGTQS